ncbi:MAG: cupin domain-containing protein [Candidatus Eremiobacterota bacterium]
MAQPGTVIENPVLGMKIRFLQTGRASGGHMLKLEYWVRPGGAREMVAHFHPRIAERFEIKAGQGEYRVGKEIKPARAGDDLTLPAGVPHIHPWNTGSEDLHFIQTVTTPKPMVEALERVERVFEFLARLAQEGKTNAQSLPRNPLQMAMVVQALQPETYLVGLPVPAQQVLLGGMAWMGQRMGYKLG